MEIELIVTRDEDTGDWDWDIEFFDAANEDVPPIETVERAVGLLTGRGDTETAPPNRDFGITIV